MGLPKKSESDNMSKEYENEEKAQQAVRNQKAQLEKNEKSKVFWSRCKSHQIANWVKEVRGKDNGFVIRSEQPLRFYEHIIATDDQKTIDFITNSRGFKSGDVVLCKDMSEAKKFTYQQTQKKQVRHEIGEEIESTLVEMRG